MTRCTLNDQMEQLVNDWGLDGVIGALADLCTINAGNLRTSTDHPDMVGAVEQAAHSWEEVAADLHRIIDERAL